MNDLQIIEALQSVELQNLPNKKEGIISLSAVSRFYGTSSGLYKKNSLTENQKRRILIAVLKELKNL